MPKSPVSWPAESGVLPWSRRCPGVPLDLVSPVPMSGQIASLRPLRHQGAEEFEFSRAWRWHRHDQILRYQRYGRAGQRQFEHSSPLDVWHAQTAAEDGDRGGGKYRRSQPFAFGGGNCDILLRPENLLLTKLTSKTRNANVRA